MAFLFIDTRQTGASVVRWLDGETFETWVSEGRAQQLLAGIKAHLEQIKVSLDGVIVVSGPGRFSSIRVGILYANILARWYRVPLFEAKAEDVETDDSLKVLVAAIGSGTRAASAYVAPVYDREPNITSPRV